MCHARQVIYSHKGEYRAYIVRSWREIGFAFKHRNAREYRTKHIFLSSIHTIKDNAHNDK